MLEAMQKLIDRIQQQVDMHAKPDEDWSVNGGSRIGLWLHPKSPNPVLKYLTPENCDIGALMEEMRDEYDRKYKETASYIDAMEKCLK